MATLQGGPPALVISYPVGADLSSYQHYFCEVASGVASVCDAITDVPRGVMQNKPDASGKIAELVVFGPTKVVAGEAITEGALIGTDAEGKAQPLVIGTDTTVYIVGVALEAASNDGEIISALINCVNPARAA